MTRLTLPAALLGLALLPLSGCGLFGPSTPPEPPETSDWTATLKRGACYGRCPVYTVSVDSSGSVQFSGERFVAASGPQSGPALAEAMPRLQTVLQPSRLANFRDSYVPGEKACGIWATDFPTLTLEIRVGSQTRTIRHYLGCERAPQGLRDLETAIDAAANVRRWTEAPAS